LKAAITSQDLVDNALHVDHLNVDRLLAEWRWLYSEPLALEARNAFGDLFLSTPDGRIFWLQVDIGNISEIAVSKSHLLDLLKLDENRETWLAEKDAIAFAERGIWPNETQCIGFKTPLIFAESDNCPDNAYVADLYEQVSFLGDLNKQLVAYPDGTKVKLVIKQ
jgi:hypothetical protein